MTTRKQKPREVKAWAIQRKSGALLRYANGLGVALWPNKKSAHLNCYYSIGQKPVRVSIKVIP